MHKQPRHGRAHYGLIVVAGSLVACAHTREDVHTSTLSVETAQPTVEPTPPPEPAAIVRPRLSQTITLGQGTESQYTPSASKPPPVAAPSSQNVVVNNNIIVQGGPQYYGGYTGYGVYGRPGVFNGEGRWGASRGSPTWGSSGWEGARRTAAPGQTPGVGGNWSPPPSFGPAPMR